MSSPPSLLLPLLLFSLQIIPIVSATKYTDGPLFYDCSGNKFTAGSPYASNLRRLFADVITSTPISPNLNFSSNSDGSVFIFAQCRLDAVGDHCAACLNQSIITVGDLCSGNRTASIRYSYCVLRYSDNPFLSVADTPWFNNVFSTNTAANTAEFSRKVGDMLAGILPEAARSEKKVAVGSTEILSEPPNSMKIYGLAWCTNDLSPDDCFQCLDHALKGYMGCCAYYTGGGRMTTSCIVTYDDHAMYNETMLQAAPVAAPSAGETDKRRGRKTMEIVIILAVSLASVLAITALCVLLIRRRRQAAIRKTESKIGAHEEEIRTVESLHIPLSILKAATYNFSDENKLGEGRFGPVYKGVLTDGRQIVVKRLSNTSCRGLDELRNEAALVAQLQHKNLVKLHGCCMQENEKLLVYEYLSNASLEKHLFDPARRAKMDWRKRHMIIEGISRGLVYLHTHSRVRIIHRNLNASNILLDDEMNPKISDFGLAKLVGIDQSQWNTKQIAGTFGYMAPEYATRGLFSAKSDVFSFGMVVLEILTGRRNSSFMELGRTLNLQSYVWQQWNRGTTEEVIDRNLGEEYQVEQVVRSIHVGLLCVQADPSERPTMLSAVLMLSAYTDELPAPAPPGFYTGETNPSIISAGLSSGGAITDFTSPELLSFSSRDWTHASVPEGPVSLNNMEAR